MWSRISWSKLFRLSIRSQYLLVLVGFVSGISLLLIALHAYQANVTARDLATTSSATMSEKLSEQMVKRGELLSSNLAANLLSPLYFYDMEAIYRQLKVAKEHAEIVDIQLFDAKGTIVHDGSHEIARFGQPMDNPELLELFQEKPHQHMFNMHRHGKLLMVHRLEISSQTLGGLQISFSLDNIKHDITETEELLNQVNHQALLQQLYTTTGVILILLSMAILLSIRAARYMADPISALVKRARAIGHGDYSSHFSLNRTDELENLAQALNEMSVNIASHDLQMKHQALHDALTLLPNRRMLLGELEQAIEKNSREQQLMALIFIDIDEFKQVNDSLGHDVGDKLLQRVASRLNNSLRPDDHLLMTEDNQSSLLCRIGGDEFTVVLEGLNRPEDAGIIAERILQQLNQPFHIEEHRLTVGCSLGITIAPIDGNSVETLLKNADMAMYQAKCNGKNHYRYYSKDLDLRLQKVILFKEQIDTALQQNQFQLMYQPQVDLNTGATIGSEALIRWHHDDMGWISPAEFIPIAEQTGQIKPLGSWILRTACQQLAKWQTLTDPLYIAVNLSAEQISDPGIVDEIEGYIRRYNLNPKQLHLELTETSLLKNSEQAKQIVDALYKLDCPIWLDDFGTGYSSISHLNNFALTGIKIDRSFVSTLGKHQQGLTEGLIELAKRLQLKVIAEGVETSEQLLILQTWQCDIAQGYLYSPAIPAAEFQQYVETGLLQKATAN